MRVIHSAHLFAAEAGALLGPAGAREGADSNGMPSPPAQAGQFSHERTFAMDLDRLVQVSTDMCCVLNFEEASLLFL